MLDCQYPVTQFDNLVKPVKIMFSNDCQLQKRNLLRETVIGLPALPGKFLPCL